MISTKHLAGVFLVSALTLGGGSSAATTGAPVSENIYAFGRGTTSLGDGRESFYSIGEGIDLALLESRLATLMAALT